MNSLRLRFLFPIMLFGFLPALGAARLMGHSMDWFFSTQGVLLGGGVIQADDPQAGRAGQDPRPGWFTSRDRWPAPR